MNKQIPSNKRKLILQQLRSAVDLQIELWETNLRIRDMVDCDSDPLEWVQNASITADSGTELSDRDLDEFLDCQSLHI